MKVLEREKAAQPYKQNGTQQGNNTRASGAAAHQAKRTRRPRVVVVGSGFGGLNVVREFASKGVRVLVLDRNNYHGFWPLLYQVATAGLESESIAYPVRAIIRRHRNLDFQMAEVTRVDIEKKLVYTNGHAPVSYDYLVLAAGSSNNYFGNKTLEENTIGLKDIDEAEMLRNHVLAAFEEAVREPDELRRRALLTFVIIGGGPTGVELAGAFAELIRHPLRNDYPSLDISEARVMLIEATDHVLESFPDSLRHSAQLKLEKMGVEIKLESMVESVENGVVTLKGGKQIEAHTVVWAAGVRASELADQLPVERGKGERIKVEPTLNIPGHPEVFVVGDMAYLEAYKDNKSFPMVAQVAIQQGKHAAHNILAQVEGKSMKPFKYFDPGTMATIGRRFAVLDAFGIRLTGRLAWFGWLIIHIFYLIGFRNRIIVMTNWIFNYFAFERGVRLITWQNRKRNAAMREG